MAKPCRLEGEEGFIYYHLPVTGGGDTPESPEAVAGTYLAMLDEKMDKIIHTIMDAKTNVLYFCGAGKDRTGVISAIILKKSGYNDQIIIEDYMETKDNQMILRDFKKEDAQIIAGWLQSEEELYKWSADRFNKYPLSGNDINENYAPQLETRRFYPLTAVDDNGDVLGHFIIRYPRVDDDSSVRFGFVIVNPAIRGKGYGKELLQLGIGYVKEHLSAKRIDLGVFDNNESARYCYEAVGFTAYATRECEMPIGTWKCTDMEMFIEKSLETERLILRCWNESDAEDLYKYASDPDVGPIAGWPAHQSIEESRDVIKNVFNGKEAYAVCLKEDGKAIGAIELKLNGHTDMTDRDDECEMGYWLGKPFWGQGIMPEAVKEMIRHAFEDLDMQKVWIGYYEGNAKSKRVQEKCGFKYQWRSENVDVPLMHEKRTGHVSLMTKEDWETSHRTMKRELGIARCGLACCLCSENVTCKGCKRDGFMELSWCKDAEWCEVRRCGIEKNLSGCYECNPAECRKGLYAEKIKPRAFAEYARRYGLEELLDCLERNERAGVVYHREGITGDYDDFDDLEELIDFIKTGKKMCIDLKPIAREDIETVWKMQVEAFSDLLEKYQDYDMSPAAEDMDKVLARFEQPWTTYFFIMANNEKVGVVRVVDKKDGSRKRISPIWIMPEYRNKGYAQQAILAAEKKYGSNHWCLDTILQEKGNLHLYEKLGYHQTGRIDRVNDRMDIVYYEKD